MADLLVCGLFLVLLKVACCREWYVGFEVTRITPLTIYRFYTSRPFINVETWLYELVCSIPRLLCPVLLEASTLFQVSVCETITDYDVRSSCPWPCSNCPEWRVGGMALDLHHRRSTGKQIKTIIYCLIPAHSIIDCCLRCTKFLPPSQLIGVVIILDTRRKGLCTRETSDG